MAVVTRCIHCQKLAQVPDAFADKLVRCPHCQQVFLARRDAVEPPTHLKSPSAATSSINRLASSKPSSAASAVSGSSSSVVITHCPTCRASLRPGQTLCADCGWVKQGQISILETDEQPLICGNPACGVANAPTERYCQRCHILLPTAPGTMLHGRYRVDQLIAMGGFGAVYLGEDVQARRRVAIKDMIAADGDEFQIRLQFFEREAEILKLLAGSPIVPRFHDFIKQGTAAHLIMEYIPGRDLLKVLEAQDHRPFPESLVIDWGKQICDVLALLHDQQPPIIHRDLKPDNIMLLEDGRSIKLIDFGTARDLGKSSKTRIAAKTRVFTEGYAPPEQIVGKPEIRSDLFALAGTLYHLLTGKAPEGHYTALELRDRLMGKNGALPPAYHWLYELIQINLSEDLNDRYFSAKEIKKDLSQLGITRQWSCPMCRFLNAAREPYCRQCASPLTDPMPPCSACGKMNRMGSRFCTQCGSRLR